VKNYSKETIEGIPTSPYFNYILKAAHPAAECYQAMQDFLGCNHFIMLTKSDENQVKNQLVKNKNN
jgi:uracil-DNA glycosylase